MKKLILIFTTIFIITSCSTTKLNSYGENYKKIKTQAELVSLKISDTIFTGNAIITQANNSNSFNILGNIISSDLIINQLEKIPSYINRIIKDSKKKYTQNYNANNTLTFKTGFENDILKLPNLDFRRKIFYDNKQADAIKIKFSPHPINGKKFKNTDTLFVYKLNDIIINYTKAKTTKNYPFVDLNIEIKAKYYEKDSDNKISEKEYTSSNINLPVKNGIIFDRFIIDYPIYSKPFKINNLKMVEIKVIETNPYYLKLEELESNLTENKEDLSGLFKELSKLLKKE